MSTYKDHDFKNTHFEHPELTRIHGEPTTATLVTLQREIRANAQSIPTTLGGGFYGHLGLVCNETEYASIPNTTRYVKPTNPGMLQPGATTETQFQIIQRRDEHAEQTRIFREALSVERTLVQQIVAAIDKKYLKAIRNNITSKIMLTIQEIFEYLFDTYGDVTTAELRELRATVENMTYIPTEPIDNIFTEIDEFSDIAVIAKSPISDQQRIDIAYLILQKLRQFKNGLHSWNKLPRVNQTWDNFKIHFRSEHKELKKTGQLTIEEGMNQTNLVNMISEGVKSAL